MNPVFGPTLKRLRNERQLSVRALAAEARVSVPWITLVENGHRSIGRNALERLGAGLGLHGADLDDFILLGVTAGRVEPQCRSAQPHDFRLHTALARFLHDAGILPSQIREVEAVDSLSARTRQQFATGLLGAARKRAQAIRAPRTGTAMSRPVLVLRLNNHQVLCLEFLLIEADCVASPGVALAATRNSPPPVTRAPRIGPAIPARRNAKTSK